MSLELQKETVLNVVDLNPEFLLSKLMRGQDFEKKQYTKMGIVH